MAWRAGAGGIVFQGEVGGRDGEPIVARGGEARNNGDGAKQKGRKGSGAKESLGSIHVEAHSKFRRERVAGLP